MDKAQAAGLRAHEKGGDAVRLQDLYVAGFRAGFEAYGLSGAQMGHGVPAAKADAA